MAKVELDDDNDYSIGPVGGGVYGPAVVKLIFDSDIEKKKIPEIEFIGENQVGPLVILAVNGK